MADNLDTFDWPCDRRDAHHAHSSTGKCDMDCQPDWHDELCSVYDGFKCLGVAAHPATQIGGNYLSERPESPRY